MPGLGAINKGHSASIGPLSCVSAGNCAATGTYADVPVSAQGYVVSESKGRWGKAIEIPNLGAMNKFGELLESSISCSSAGDCAVRGDFIADKDNTRAFIADEVNGKWRKAFAVPGLSVLNTGGDAELTSVSCSPGRACVAGGDYQAGSGATRGLQRVRGQRAQRHLG